MIVVSDTTAISNLVRIGEIRLLKIMYGEILLPKAVYEELLILEQKGIDIVSIIEQESFEIMEVEEDELYRELSIQLDKGEVEAIALAVKEKADFLLIDEVKGRKIASEKAIRIIGTLGILVDAKKRKLIESVKEKMDDLKAVGFWINQSLYDKIVKLEKELE